MMEAFVALLITIPRSQPSSQKQNYRRRSVYVTTNNNYNSQTQNLQQLLAVDLSLDAIKDDLTGRQMKICGNRDRQRYRESTSGNCCKAKIIRSRCNLRYCCQYIN